jgi:spore coat polysaccharide biosynthesis predicted glycosyltransferase SpsG
MVFEPWFTDFGIGHMFRPLTLTKELRNVPKRSTRQRLLVPQLQAIEPLKQCASNWEEREVSKISNFREERGVVFLYLEKWGNASRQIKNRVYGC